MSENNSEELLQLLRDLRIGQMEQIKLQAASFELQMKNQARMDQNFDRAEKLNSRAENLNSGAAAIQEMSRKILKYLLVVLAVCLSIILVLRVF